MPAGGGRWWSFWEQRARQLQCQVRVKEERIAELETENAVLHLKLAEYQGRLDESRREAVQVRRLCNQQRCLQRNAHSAFSQLGRAAQKLKQDMMEFRSSSLILLRRYQDQHQHCVSEMVTAVRHVQLSGEALRACQSEAACLQRSLQEVSTRYQLEKQRRRSLHNSLVELKGNLRVHCRIRPLLPFDDEFDGTVLQNSSNSGEVTHAVDDETVLVKCDHSSYPPINKTYHFERVYGPADSQSDVFGEVCPLLTSLLDGYNVCVMAYGQTGSGKSHTMLGPSVQHGPALPSDSQSHLGIVPRAAEELFSGHAGDSSNCPGYGESQLAGTAGQQELERAQRAMEEQSAAHKSVGGT
ncbi:kinesin-like protein KIFC1 [Carlito syrichta]|uniref:Kinesin-like protein KIFC1 n=1 Tax=Carlito syrichta TaxID=1868482 RepID=A0A1U7TUU3_CARSF|nr:kinesin-like protein KIFC1 [Carlito syrichta]